MAHTPAYLQLSKSSIFYFRIRVPEALRSVVGKREIHRSLRTRCHRVAIIAGGRLLAACEYMFEQALKGKAVSLPMQEAPEAASEQTASNQVVTLNSAQNPSQQPLQSVPKSPLLSAAMVEYLTAQRLNGVSEKTIGDKRSVVTKT